MLILMLIYLKVLYYGDDVGDCDDDDDNDNDEWMDGMDGYINENLLFYFYYHSPYLPSSSSAS